LDERRGKMHRSPSQPTGQTVVPAANDFGFELDRTQLEAQVDEIRLLFFARTETRKTEPFVLAQRMRLVKLCEFAKSQVARMNTKAEIERGRAEIVNKLWEEVNSVITVPRLSAKASELQRQIDELGPIAKKISDLTTVMGVSPQAALNILSHIREEYGEVQNLLTAKLRTIQELSKLTHEIKIFRNEYDRVRSNRAALVTKMKKQGERLIQLVDMMTERMQDSLRNTSDPEKKKAADEAASEILRKVEELGAELRSLALQLESSDLILP